MGVTKRALQKYVDAASDLAVAVRNDIAHDNKISKATVLKLNSFIIAANEIDDLQKQLSNDTTDNNENNEGLN